uniref:interleukin-33 isoform X2 n=1 Tax=Myodes glareolus TaxID=447135 RepID=UPI002021146C|nr:interleukin-33 isoform X2 [Myodes glareolus]XP_048294777.1 interleukin-33 isoform X2 [Myodes glareolus]
MKYSTSKISPAKLNNATGKSLVKTQSQQKTREICHVYHMKLRSGLIIRKEACYFEKESTKKYLQKSRRKQHEGHSSAAVKNNRSGPVGARGPSFKASAEPRRSIESTNGISPVEISQASLSTYNDQSVSFKVLKDGRYVINVEDSGEFEGNDKMLLRYYESSRSSSESGDGVDGKLLMVDMSPVKDTDIRLHANEQNHCVKLEKCQAPLPPAVFFIVHEKASNYVSFECTNQPGTYIGVKDNQLALLEGEKNNDENIMFKLSKQEEGGSRVE